MLAEAFDTLWTVAALRVAVDRGLVAALASSPCSIEALARAGRLEQPLVARIVDVLVASGLFAREGDVVSLSDEGRREASRGDALAADLAVTLANTRAFVEDAREDGFRTGWRPRDPEIIRAQGTLSHALILRTARRMAELWPELGRAFAREGAVFLDVGVGSAGGAIAMCEVFPNLRVVGIDPLPDALVAARANVAARGLTERIELRALRGEELAGDQAFDVAFLPTKFLDDVGLEGTLRALQTALRPDGFVLTSAWRAGGEPRAVAVSRLRDELAGGGPRPAEVVTAALERHGFHRVRLGPATGTQLPILASR